MALPSFDSANEALHVLDALGEASETHGLLCALFASGAKMRKQAWLHSLLSQSLSESDKVEQDAAAVLTRLYDATQEAFASEELLTIDLLLPDEDVPIAQRIEALSLWAIGFITGLKLAGMEVEKNANEELQEAFTDLINISCLSQDEEGGDEAENALAELIEYARVAVGHIHQEIMHDKSGSQGDNKTKH